jgi:membrane protease YdiL (CAAX protease family)
MSAQQPMQAALPASTTALRQWVTRHPVLAYLILAFSVTWTIWLIPLFSKEGIGLLPYHVPSTLIFNPLASILGLMGSAFLVTALVDGRAGVRALARRLVRWRVGVQWYLLALFGLLLVGLVAQSVFHGVGSLGAAVRQGPALLSYLVALVIGAVVVHLWEDTGWVGFMFTRLQPRFGALVASLLVAPCLGAIHLPLLFITDGVTAGRLPPSQYPMAALDLLVLLTVPILVLVRGSTTMHGGA